MIIRQLKDGSEPTLVYEIHGPAKGHAQFVETVLKDTIDTWFSY